MAKDRGLEITVALGVFVGLSWLFVFLRIIVRSCITKSWKVDDSLLAVSLVFYTLYGAAGLCSVKFGSGQHNDQVSLVNIPKALQAWWFDEILYALTTLFVRLSISVFLLRLSTRSLHKNIIYATQVSVIIFTISFIILVIFQCSPFDYFWKQYQGTTGSCIDINIVPEASVVHSTVGFAVDWTLGLLPIWIMWDVNMSIRVKFSVAGVLSLGLLAGIATLIRIPFIKTLAITDDFLYATTDIAIWSTIEPGLGIIAFSGATLRPLLRYFFPHTFSSLSPNDCLGQQIQPYRTAYTGRPNYQYNLNLMANKQASKCMDSNSTHTASDADSRVSSYTFTSSTFDSKRSSRSTVGTGKERYGSMIMSTIRKVRLSDFSIREEDEETIIGAEQGWDGGKKDHVKPVVKEVQDEAEDLDISTMRMEKGSGLTNSIVEATKGME